MSMKENRHIKHASESCRSATTIKNFRIKCFKISCRKVFSPWLLILSSDQNRLRLTNLAEPRLKHYKLLYECRHLRFKNLFFHLKNFFVKRVYIENLRQKFCIDRKLLKLLIFLRSHFILKRFHLALLKYSVHSSTLYKKVDIENDYIITIFCKACWGLKAS